MSDKANKPPTLWVCTACGKTAPDRMGDGEGTMRGWDESCFLHAVECLEDTVERGPDGRAVKAKAYAAPVGLA